MRSFLFLVLLALENYQNFTRRLCCYSRACILGTDEPKIKYTLEAQQSEPPSRQQLPSAVRVIIVVAPLPLFVFSFFFFCFFSLPTPRKRRKETTTATTHLRCTAKKKTWSKSIEANEISHCAHLRVGGPNLANRIPARDWSAKFLRFRAAKKSRKTKPRKRVKEKKIEKIYFAMSECVSASSSTDSGTCSKNHNCVE